MYPQCVGISTHTVPSNCNCTKFALNHLETVTLPPAAMDLRVRQEGAPSPVSPGTCFSSRAHSSRVEREMTDSPCLLQYLLAVFSAHHLRDYRSYRWSCGKGSRGLSHLRKRGCQPRFPPPLQNPCPSWGRGRRVRVAFGQSVIDSYF